MAQFNKFNAFVEDLAKRVHKFDTVANSGDTLTVALTDTTHAPVATNAILADLTQISYTFLSSRTLVVATSAQTAGLYKLILNDLVLTASGGAVGPFRYVVIFNNTPTNKNLIGWYDYGVNITLADGETLTIDFDNVNGILQLQ